MSRSQPLSIDTSEAIRSLDGGLDFGSGSSYNYHRSHHHINTNTNINSNQNNNNNNNKLSQIRPTLKKQVFTAYISGTVPSVSSKTLEERSEATSSQHNINTITPSISTSFNTLLSRSNNNRISKSSTSNSSSSNSNSNINSISRNSVTSVSRSIAVGSDASDEQQSNSAEDNLSQHTNFIFNWRMRKSDEVSAVEALNKQDLNVLTLATLSEMQRPLIFGMIAGTTLLTLVLFLYACVVRQQQRTSGHFDKTSLMTDEVHSQVVSIPPPLAVAAAAAASSSSTSGCSSSIQMPTLLPTTSQPHNHMMRMCRTPATCTRYMLKV